MQWPMARLQSIDIMIVNKVANGHYILDADLKDDVLHDGKACTFSLKILESSRLCICQFSCRLPWIRLETICFFDTKTNTGSSAMINKVYMNPPLEEGRG